MYTGGNLGRGPQVTANPRSNSEFHSDLAVFKSEITRAASAVRRCIALLHYTVVWLLALRR